MHTAARSKELSWGGKNGIRQPRVPPTSASTIERADVRQNTRNLFLLKMTCPRYFAWAQATCTLTIPGMVGITRQVTQMGARQAKANQTADAATETKRAERP